MWKIRCENTYMLTFSGPPAVPASPTEHLHEHSKSFLLTTHQNAYIQGCLLPFLLALVNQKKSLKFDISVQ